MRGDFLSDVRNIAQLTLDPAAIPVREHLTRFAQVLGRAATVRALNPREPWRILSDFTIYDTTEGQAIFCHLSPMEYSRAALDSSDTRAPSSVAITICLEGELVLTYSRDHQVKATPGQLVLGLTRAATHITVPVPSRYVILYIARPSMLSATSLTDSHPVIDAVIPADVTPVLVTMLQQLHRALGNKDDQPLGPILKSLEVLVDQLARPQFLRFSQVSEDRMMAIQAFVDENVRNPQLGVKLLCDRFHMSRATLYRQMQYLGGVKHYLQARRLVCCYDDIRKSPYSEESFLKVLVKSYNFRSLKDFRQRYAKHFGADPLIIVNTQDMSLTAPSLSNQVFLTHAGEVDS